MSTSELREAKQINVSERLDETRHAIAFLRGMAMDVPDEAIELLHIMERCVAAESRIASEHPPDDDTPIDEEWCLSHGARKWDAGEEFIFGGAIRWAKCLGESGVLRGGVYIEPVDNRGIRQICHMPQITTRGQLRRLCEALGVQLKEGK